MPIILYKEKGETPLACIERLRQTRPELQDEKLSYAGRLDPMAEGVLPVLVGEENKERDRHLKQSKTYTFDVLFGFATDTYDVLGKLTTAPKREDMPRIQIPAVLQAVAAWRGVHTQPYPPFSSKTVDGKPLFAWAREGKIDTIARPTQNIEIFESAFVGLRIITAESLWTAVDEAIARVKGDFRQKEIRDCWWEHLRVLSGATFAVASCTISCSSGTYVRGLAHELGEKIGVPALAFSIVRTKVGEHAVEKESLHPPGLD